MKNIIKNKTLLTAAIISAMAFGTTSAYVVPTTDAPGDTPNKALSSNSEYNDVYAGHGAYSVGRQNTINASATSSFAAGYDNTINGANSFVYGHNNKATGANSIAGGENSEAKGYSSLAIGSSSQALKDYTFAIGSQASAAADNTVAIGNGAYANKDNALALGAVTSVDGKDSIALGSHVRSNADNNVAIGTAVTTNSNDSVGIGTAVNTNSNNSIGIGNNVVNNLSNSIGIGNGVATDFNTIGIGNGVETKVQDTIAIGNGVISNGESSVAIGNAIHADGVGTVNVGTNVSAKGVSSIVVGRDTTVNGDDTTVVGANNGIIDADQSAIFGYNNKMLDNAKEQLIFGSNSQTKEQGATVLGSHAQATQVDAFAIGNNTIADVQNGVAIGTNSVTELAVGTSNIKDNTTDIRFSNSTYAGSNPDSVVSFGTNGRAGAGGVTSYTRQLQNVAAGRVSATSTDAINGSQLYDVALEAQKHNTVVDGTNTTVTSEDNNFGRKEYKVNVNKDLVDMNSASFGKVTDDVHSYIGKDKVHFFDGTTSTNTKVDANGMKLENTDNLDAAEYTMDGMTANSNGKSISFTTNGISAGGQIINNVKAGVADTDAVNYKQLKDSISTESVITDNQVDNIAAVRVVNGKSTGDANAQYGVYVSKNTVTDIAKAANKFEGDSVIKVETTTGANHTADTTTFKFDGNEAAKVLPVSYKANGGATNKVMADKGLNFVNGNHINASVGADGLVRFDLDQNIPNQINSNANAINGLSDKVAKNHKISERGIAGTAALAALHPLDFDPDHKLDVMAGYGHFHGSNSVALGAAYRPNEDLMFTVGSTVGNGDTVVNAGVSYKVGAKSGVSRSKVAVAKDVADMKREMEAMKAQNAKITAILNAVLGADLPQDQNTVFPDVPENHWAFEAVDDLAKRGLIIGYEDGMFKGDRVLTRYEFAEVVHRAIQRAKEINAPIDGRLVDEFKPELLRFEVEQNGKLERVHALKSNKDIKRDSYGSIVK
jgi:putative lipoprotein